MIEEGLMSTLARAIEIAARAHEGQRDKSGEPYISHPLRIALDFIRTGDETRAIIAVLHDVIEDSAVTAADLEREGFALAIVEAVTALTRRDDEDYQDFVARAGQNDLARLVKIADLKDNLDKARLAKLPAEKRDQLLRKYKGALQALGDQK
jgi:(p)ppGpp synthase/HD superfamily hydrolase